MEKDVFKKFINELVIYFGADNFFKKENNESRLDIWFAAVKFIPSGDPLNFILAQIKNDFDSLPRNIPRVIKQYWTIYQESNRDKIEHYRTERPENKCQYCIDGLLLMRKKSNCGDHYVESVGRCGHCKSRTETQFGPFLFADRQREKGYKVYTPARGIRGEISGRDYGWI